MIEEIHLDEELETQLDETEYDKVRQFSSSEQDISQKNNIFLSLTQLLVPCMGIGTLALPYCASKSGLIAELIILSFSALISCISMHLISWSSCKLGSLSYGEIVQTTLGTNFRNLFDIFVILGTTLNCVNVQISFQFLIYEILQQLNFQFDQQRIMLTTQIIFTFLNLFFSLQRSLQRLKYVSMLGLFSIIYLIGLINYEFSNKRIDFDQIVLFELNPDLLTTYTITFFCFVCHLFILPVMKNLKQPTNQRRSQLWILWASVCFFAYLLIIIAGYLNFQKDTQFWIINNFKSWQSVIGNIGISISLFFSVPFMMIASKNIIKDRLQRDQNDSRLVLLITIIQQVGTGVIAIIFPEIKKLLSLLGGFTGTTTVCLFPLLIYMKLFKFNYLIIILELIAIFLGYGGAIFSQFQ